MAINLLTQSFGTSKAGLNVTLRNASTQAPASIFDSNSRLLNDQGQAKLDASGNMAVYVDTANTYQVSVVSDLKAATGGITADQANALGTAFPGDAVGVLIEATPYVNRTTTGTAFTGPCELAGYDCTVAAGNITIYDNTSAAGTVIVPTTALTVGRVEFQWKRQLTTGCHVVLSGAATVNVLVG